MSSTLLVVYNLSSTTDLSALRTQALLKNVHRPAEEWMFVTWPSLVLIIANPSILLLSPVITSKRVWLASGTQHPISGKALYYAQCAASVWCSASSPQWSPMAQRATSVSSTMPRRHKVASEDGGLVVQVSNNAECMGTGCIALR